MFFRASFTIFKARFRFSTICIFILGFLWYLPSFSPVRFSMSLMSRMPSASSVLGSRIFKSGSVVWMKEFAQFKKVFSWMASQGSRPSVFTLDAIARSPLSHSPLLLLVGVVTPCLRCSASCFVLFSFFWSAALVYLGGRGRGE